MRYDQDYFDTERSAARTVRLQFQAIKEKQSRTFESARQIHQVRVDKAQKELDAAISEENQVRASGDALQPQLDDLAKAYEEISGHAIESVLRGY